MHSWTRSSISQSHFSASHASRELAPPAWPVQDLDFDLPDVLTPWKVPNDNQRISSVNDAGFLFKPMDRLERKNDFGLPSAMAPFKMSHSDVQISNHVGNKYNVDVHVVYEASPSFEKGANGTFIMHLQRIHGRATTACSPRPGLLSGVTFLRPQESFCITLPDVQQVVFDPSAGELAGSASISKQLNVLEVSEVAKECSLDGKVHVEPSHGSSSIQVQKMMGHQKVLCEASLRYDVMVTGRLSEVVEGGHRWLMADLDFEFRYWFGGSACDQVARQLCPDLYAPVQEPGFPHRRALSFQEQKSEASDTQSGKIDNNPVHPISSGEEQWGRADFLLRRGQETVGQLPEVEELELKWIEEDVADISKELRKEFIEADLTQMKNNLSQLEAKAKSLESKGVDGIYTGELNSGKQLAKDTKKDMLGRLEELFKQIDSAFAKIKARQRGPTVNLHATVQEPSLQRRLVVDFHEQKSKASDTESAKIHNDPVRPISSDEERLDRADFLRRRGRCMSRHSQEALGQLSGIEEELEQIEEDVADISKELQKEPVEADLTQMKNNLSQLEAKAKSLESKGVDGIYTGELNSGKQLAKDTKKDMLGRLEELFKQIDSAFAKIKARQSGSAVKHLKEERAHGAAKIEFSNVDEEFERIKLNMAERNKAFQERLAATNARFERRWG